MTMRPTPNPNRAVYILSVLVLAFLIISLNWGCGSPRPRQYDPNLEPPDIQYRWCARALTFGSETVRLCTTSRKLCRHAVATARRHGQSFLIRKQELRLHSVEPCKEQP